MMMSLAKPKLSRTTSTDRLEMVKIRLASSADSPKLVITRRAMVCVKDSWSR